MTDFTVKGASFVWTHGMELAELRLTTDDGQHTFALRDRTVLLLFEQMWNRRVGILARESGSG